MIDMYIVYLFSGIFFHSSLILSCFFFLMIFFLKLFCQISAANGYISCVGCVKSVENEIVRIIIIIFCKDNFLGLRPSVEGIENENFQKFEQAVL